MRNRIKTMDAGNASSSPKDQKHVRSSYFALKSQVLQPAYIRDTTETEKNERPC